MRKEEKSQTWIKLFLFVKSQRIVRVQRLTKARDVVLLGNFTVRNEVWKVKGEEAIESISSSLVPFASRVFSARLAMVDLSAYRSPSFSKNDSNENTLHASNTGRVNNVIQNQHRRKWRKHRFANRKLILFRFQRCSIRF